MDMVGEAVVTASIDLLLKKLVSSQLLSFAGREQIKADLTKWRSKLSNIYAVLQDAEEKQITNSCVKKWLVDLQNLAYDVEDILDEFETEALKRKLSHESQASTSKALMLIPTCCTNFNPRSLQFNMKMGSGIKDITERLEDIVARKNELQLLDIRKEGSDKVKRSDQRLPTTSLSETHVFGREEDQEAIVKLLLKNEASEDRIPVIPIVGIGGVGKTTLAQNVYNDARVKSHFDLRAWVCVSDDFNVIRITKTILQQICTDIDGDHSDLNKLQVKLQEKLLGRKFFVVLDDIWTDDYIMWTSLLRPYEARSSGSKIVITTRNNNASSNFGTVPARQLAELPFDDCLSIFTHHSLGRKNFDEHQNLKEVGEKIVSKCDGLPLAVKTLAGLLRNNVERDHWKHVLYSNIWDLPQGADGIMPALKLSYYYLSPHLKRCFAYCSLLPKDYEFEKDEIILLWMAQGFLQQNSGKRQMEDLGDEYFQELQSRSFFQQSNNNTSRYVMHDLINDLAQSVAGTFFFLKMENTMESGKQNDISKNLRHLSYVCGELDGIKKFKGLTEFKHLRTVLPLSSSGAGEITSEIFNILSKLCRLRVLSLNGYCNIDELPSAIGDLKQLRHIDLSNSEICCLPESINSLYNLLTLKLEGCYELRKLCDVGNLINLRYLNTSRTGLQEMPSNMGKLTSLRILSDFVVSCNTGPGLKALKLLKHLQGALRIRGLENIHDVVDAKEADLCAKSDVRELVLEWSKDHFVVVDLEVQVLKMLRPNAKLERLTISGYGGVSLPPWLEDTFFSNLVSLRIEDCINCTSLPSVGQLPSLKTLLVCSMNGIKRIGPEFYGNGSSRPFPSLETLYLEDMQEWEEWISYGNGQEVEGFPHLQELSIVDCPKLQGRLPEHLPSLKRLVISECKELLVSIASLPEDCRLEIDGCKQVHPRIEIDFGSLYPIIFSDVHRGQVFLLKRFKQSQSEDEGVEIVGYEASTAFWYSGIASMQDARNFCNQQYARHQIIKHLLHKNEEELQLQGLPYVCHYLALDNVCLRTLPQVLLNLGFLRRICISNCSDLVSFPEASLPSQLRGIDIDSCDLLECLPDSWMESTSLECLCVSYCKSLMLLARNQLSPNLKELWIFECNALKTLMQEENKSLQSSIIVIAECSSTKSLFLKREFPVTLELIAINFCNKLEALPHNMHQLNHLRDLKISCCSSLVSFPVGGLPSTNLTNLRISYCHKLEELPNNMHHLEHLQELEVSGCSSLVSFPAGGLPSTNLTNLLIANCQKLEELPNNMHQLEHLQEINILDCSSIVSFPVGGLPSTNLKMLLIAGCGHLKAVPKDVDQLHHLQKIYISDCSSLVSFPEEGLPSTNLTELTIDRCEKLEALPNNMHQLNHLLKIKISKCSSLVSFPEAGLPSTNLTELTIDHCEKLKGLPKCMHNLSSLREVMISNCQAMESLPKDGFPINLVSLGISHTPKICQVLFKWGLHRLSSLRKLYLCGCPDVVSFPPEEAGIMLPSSLTILDIREFVDLECLSSVIQSLNSLERLNLFGCPKLKSFPKKGLPLSLLNLQIFDCPLLEQNCQKNGGRYWPMIAYIPRIDLPDC